MSVSGIIKQDNKSKGSVGTFGMPINTLFWSGALDTVNFMPLNSADPIGGTILLTGILPQIMKMKGVN